MKKLLVLAIASLFSTAAVAGDIKWNGSAGMRYNQTILNDSLQGTTTVGTAQKDISKSTTRTHAIRANIGATGGWEHVEWGLGFRTGGAGVTTSDYANLGGAAGVTPDVAIGIEQGWVKYNNDFGFGDLSLIMGRQKAVFASDMGTEQLFDKDLRFDGFGWQWKWGSFGLNAAQYIVGALNAGAQATAGYTYTDATQAVATTQGKFSVLYGFQPHMSWRFSDEIDAMFAVGYYTWSATQQTANTIHGGFAPFAAAGGTGSVLMNNNKQWQFLAQVNLPFSLMFSGEYIMNKETLYGNAGFPNRQKADKDAFALGLTYGKLKKAQDFTIGYAFNSKGLASVANVVTNGLLPADNTAHFVKLGYNMADNLMLGWNGIFATEKSKKDSTGAAVTGAAANQKHTRSYWELVAGVSF